MGYDSTNVYKIFVRASEVISNDDEVLGGDIQDIKDDLFRVSVDELTTFLKKIDIRVQPSKAEDNTCLGTEMENLLWGRLDLDSYSWHSGDLVGSTVQSYV